MPALLPLPSATLQLLGGLIDYAGFFPPAGLSVEASWANYQRYRQTLWAPLLGKLVLPAAKLADLAQVIASESTSVREKTAVGLPPAHVAISAVLPGPPTDLAAFASAVAAVRAFNKSCSAAAQVDTIECRVDCREEWDQASRIMAADTWSCFWELPPTASLPELLADLRAANAAAGDSPVIPRHFAKIRTGGVVPEAIPPAEGVAAFLIECCRYGVGFKATAGLHHPLRATHPLTYQPAAPCGLMHGFVNVFVAAVAARQGWSDPQQLLPILNAATANDFGLTDQTIGWRDHVWSLEQVRTTRQTFALSFGSCSFAEPVTDLQSLGWLPSTSESLLA